MAEIKLYCEIGQAEATISVEADADLRDNVDGHRVKPCNGCKKWTGTNQLDQLLVDKARFKGGEHKLIVGMCTPTTDEAIDMPFVTGVSKDGALELDEQIYPRGNGEG